MTNARNISFLLVLLAFAIGVVFYPAMPQQMVSHWNWAGEPDGFVSKEAGVFLFPAAIFTLALILYLLPKIDPLGVNYRFFQKEYDKVLLAIILFFFWAHLLVIGYNAGFRVDFSQAIAPLFAVLFFYLGKLMEKSKQNWFVGIRTPWTMSSKSVWEKTNSLGGRALKAAAALSLLAIFAKEFFAISIGVTLAAFVLAFFYSYFEYQKEKKRKKK
ncbi:MAG: DUF1648 domain-containing protein [Candidatus Micrarchaeota archaeon]|nr:DUF1648 domain-containing protein [Candidatus Micrarchaeota archaeon]